MTSTDHPAENVRDRIATWHVVTGSARGAAHNARGRPNQDAVARHDGPDGAVIVAVADGHGHDRHFRSAAGSALAVVVACPVASRMAARLAAGAPRAEAAALAGELPQAIVADWRSAVAAQLAVRPYTAEEQSALDLADDPPEVPYGSTLLVALIAADWLVCAQIGDGDLLAVRPDGRSFQPVAATTGSTASARRACASRTPWRPSGPPRTTCVRCRCRLYCSPPTATATPRPRSRGSPGSPGTSPSSPPSMTITGSGSKCPAGRSAARRPRAAGTTRRSRCCCAPRSSRRFTLTRKGTAEVDGLIQPGHMLRMERAGAALMVEKRIGEGGQGVVHGPGSTARRSR